MTLSIVLLLLAVFGAPLFTIIAGSAMLGYIECSERLFAIGDSEHPVSLTRDQRFHVVPDARVIIDHQYSKTITHQLFTI